MASTPLSSPTKEIGRGGLKLPPPPPAWNHHHGTHKNRACVQGPHVSGFRQAPGKVWERSSCSLGPVDGGDPVSSLVSRPVQRWCSPRHVTSDALRLFPLVTAFSEPGREDAKQKLHPSRAEVLGTPAPSTPRPAHHGAITLVCVGRFTVKREEANQRAQPSKNLILKPPT